MNRIVLSLTVLTLATPAFAGRPFLGRRRPATSHQTTNRQAPSRPANSYRHVLDSPEQMTRLFGPSILIREEVKDSRFVTQPVN